ncbi:hypothetical protein [Haloarcula sp. H-GB5]
MTTSTGWTPSSSVCRTGSVALYVAAQLLMSKTENVEKWLVSAVAVLLAASTVEFSGTKIPASGSYVNTARS